MSKMKELAADLARAALNIRQAQDLCHSCAKTGNWWWNKRTDNLFTREETWDMVPTKLMLTVSELSEAMEAHRKNLPDDKLPHRDGVEVELADAVIRIFDLAGALGYDLGAAMAEKLQYNLTRADHSLAARKAKGGKSY